MRKFTTKMTQVGLLMLLVVSLVTNAEASWQQSDRVLLEEVKAITLHQGRMTNGRRSAPVQQLQCVGGSAKHRFQPQTVQCYNQGSDGTDVQWECKADMDNAYRFGKVQVSCEGYDSPYDPYILKGSCGLEYTIDLTEEGFQKGYQSGGSYSHSNNYQQKEKTGDIGGLFTFVGVLMAIFVVYQMCIKPNQHRQPPQQGSQPPPYGFRPEFQQPPQGPPPSYESTQQDSPFQHASAPFENMGSNVNSESNSGPGFWSGAATGGILGYMAGSRSRTDGSGNTGWGAQQHHHSNNQSSAPSTPSSSGTRTASGFGGTSRR